MDVKEAIILCGGKGSRLGSTEERPKCMELVAGRPILEWIVRQAVSKGVEHVILVIGVGGGKVKEHFGSGTQYECDISYVSNFQGTGTAFLAGQYMLKDVDPFLVMNGDTFCEFSLENVSHGVVAVFSGKDIGMTVMRDSEGNIRFGRRGEWCSAGVYIFPGITNLIVDSAARIEDYIEGMPGQILLVEHDKFYDIGTPERLATARVGLSIILPIRFAMWEVISLEMWCGRLREDMATCIGMSYHKVKEALRFGKIMICGNGGSMADALHFATELENGLVKGRDGGGKRVMVLGSEVPYLTARVNDLAEGTHTIFAKLVETWADKGDLLICLSTSGESENVVRAAIAAKERGCLVVGFCAESSRLAGIMHQGFTFPKRMGVQRIQEITYVALHCIAGLVEG